MPGIELKDETLKPVTYWLPIWMINKLHEIKRDKKAKRVDTLVNDALEAYLKKEGK